MITSGDTFLLLMAQKILWKPNDGKQTFALTRTEFEILYGGARGGGKTDCGIAWLLKPITNPLYRALVIRHTADDLSDWCDRAERIFAAYGGVKKGQPVAFYFPSGAVIRTGHLNDDKAFSKYQGHEYQRMLIEELSQIPSKFLYEKLKTSCRSTVDGIDPRIFCTTNPDLPGLLWIKDYWQIGSTKPCSTIIDPKTKRTRIFIPARVEDNPVLMQKDPTYVTMLEGLADTNLRNAWRYGSWDIHEVKGAYYADQLKFLDDNNRITDVPHDPALLTHTAWDLGVDDEMAIWFFQIVGNVIRLIDYMADTDEGLDYYVKELRKKSDKLGYVYGKHYLPHDVMVRSMETGRTRYEFLNNLGIKGLVAPRGGLADGIQSVRNILPLCWIDKARCGDGLISLRSYRKKRDETLQTNKAEPVHDRASHGADALRSFAVMWNPSGHTISTANSFNRYAKKRVNKLTGELMTSFNH